MVRGSFIACSLTRRLNFVAHAVDADLSLDLGKKKKKSKKVALTLDEEGPSDASVRLNNILTF